MIEVYHPHYMHQEKNENAESFAAPCVYDVLRTPDDKKIIALFSYFYIPNKEFSLLEVLCQGEPVKYTITYLNQAKNPAHRWQTGLVEINIPPQCIGLKNSITAEFKWNLFNHHVDIPPSPFSYLNKPATMTLMTLQKDNPLELIRDWCLYYHRAHQVPHIVLYDNASRNLDTLVQGLYQLSPRLEIKIIAWNFPYYFKSKGDLHAPCFHAQIAALNHWYYALGNYSTYFLNFDIDEYLVNRTDKPLLEYLNVQPALRILNLTIPCYWVPTVYADGFSKETVSQNRVFHFPYHFKSLIDKHYPKTKYLAGYGEESEAPPFQSISNRAKAIFSYREDLKNMVRIHGNFHPSPRKYQRIIDRGWRLYHRLIKLRIPYMLSILVTSSLEKSLTYKRHYSHWLLPRLLFLQKIILQKLHPLYFNHYHGLSSNPTDRCRRIPRPYSPLVHKVDKEMMKTLHSVNLSGHDMEQD